jgi:hypothetical protein
LEEEHLLFLALLGIIHMIIQSFVMQWHAYMYNYVFPAKVYIMYLLSNKPLYMPSIEGDKTNKS